MMRIFRAMAIAFSTYSRIPMPQVEWSEENQKLCMCFFPLVGAVVGICLAAWLWLADFLGFGALMKGAFGAVIPLLVTGGIHMDGFMDTCDAVASWQPREKRLEILKDTHTGAFAVIGCAAYLLCMAAIMGEMGAKEMLAVVPCFVLSRAMSALMLTYLPNARKSGMLSDITKSLEKKAATAACAGFAALCAAAFLLMQGWAGLLPIAAAAVCALYYRHFAMKTFGGVTGDLAGWFVQISEAAMLLMVMTGGKIG